MDQNSVHDRPMKVYILSNILEGKIDKEMVVFIARNQDTLLNSVLLGSREVVIREEDLEVEIETEITKGAIEDKRIEAEVKAMNVRDNKGGTGDLDKDNTLLTITEEENITEEVGKDIGDQNLQDQDLDHNLMKTAAGTDEEV
jgi:hypothetical protein